MKTFLKEGATSLTALVFLVVGTTGVLLFFHLFEVRIKEMHEILGLVFAAAALAHLYFNWASMKRYFSKKTFLGALAVVVVVAATFVATAKTGENPKAVILDRVLNAPLPHAMAVLGIAPMQYGTLLKKKGMQPVGMTIADIAQNNRVSPFEIVMILTEKK